MKNVENHEEPKIRATLNYPDHSDMRGFSYKAPSVVNEPETDPKSLELARQANPVASHFEEEDEDITAQEAGERADYKDLPTSVKRTPEMDASANTVDEDSEDGTANDDEDVLEKVRGGLRADTPDDNDFDGTEPKARTA